MPVPDDLAYLRSEIRDLSERSAAGGLAAPWAFSDLASRLFSRTILHPSSAVAMIQSDRPDAFMLGSRFGPPGLPLKLKNDAFLKLIMSLYVDTAPPHWLKTWTATFQYQLDQDPDSQRWIFRYEYLRESRNHHPAAHLHVRGTLESDCLPAGETLKDVHFPTGRVSIEALLRLLVEAFRVPCDDWSELWRPLLAESERAFLAKVHHPLSGPAE